jgi:hypothetical protein
VRGEIFKGLFAVWCDCLEGLAEPIIRIGLELRYDAVVRIIGGAMGLGQRDSLDDVALTEVGGADKCAPLPTLGLEDRPVEGGETIGFVSGETATCSDTGFGGNQAAGAILPGCESESLSL